MSTDNIHVAWAHTARAARWFVALQWNYRSVLYGDDSESYNHYAAGNWGGIVGVVRGVVAGSAL